MGLLNAMKYLELPRLDRPFFEYQDQILTIRSLSKVLLLLNCFLPSLCFSATQGTLGTSSTGTVNVSITIPALVQISGLSDITFGSTSTFPASSSTTACVYSNVLTPSAGSYYVTASSANTSGTDFRVKGTVSSTDYFIVYSASWNGVTALSSGVKTAQQTGGSAVSVTCGGTPNASFNVGFTAGQVQGAPAATYTDVVTLLITPT